jgi:hypothetical protein
MEKPLKSFLDSLNLAWFSHAGEPCPGARTVDSMQTGWDREGKKGFELWDQQTHALEEKARSSLGDNRIDEIFATVSEAIQESLGNGMSAYLDRVYRDTAENRTVNDAVLLKVIESVKRDVCWAAVEHVLNVDGFFSRLLGIYRTGHWACSWDGEYPKGRPVIL